jgi:GTP-binding protein LepA
VGFVVAGIKDIKGAPVGDTLISAAHQDTLALPWFPEGQTAGLRGNFHC